MDFFDIYKSDRATPTNHIQKLKQYQRQNDGEFFDS